MVAAHSHGICIIGPEITVRGSLSGNENVLVEGRIEGSVALRGQLTVAASGHVEADLDVESAVVQGQVRGDITATASIHIESGAHVSGRLKAPRVIIDDGARFDGGVEMDVDLPDHLRKSVR